MLRKSVYLENYGMTGRPALERRQRVRVRFDASVCVQPILRPLPINVRHLLSEDLSEGGMRLSSSEFFPVKSRVRVDLETARPATPIQVIGRVVWVEQLPEVDHWRVGVEFSDLSDGARSRLHEIVAQRRAEGGMKGGWSRRVGL
jgi:c-di-GMP-binding flagellar brake protein YcgR